MLSSINRQHDRQELALLIIAVLSAALIHVSIAASQSLLGVGIGLMLIFRRPLLFPRIWVPLAIFFALTFTSLLLSADPWGGRPQIRKFYVFLLIPLLIRSLLAPSRQSLLSGCRMGHNGDCVRHLGTGAVLLEVPTFQIHGRGLLLVLSRRAHNRL